MSAKWPNSGRNELLAVERGRNPNPSMSETITTCCQEAEDQKIPHQGLNDCYERLNAEPRNDLLSMMAHHVTTRNMDPANLLGNISLLIVGGNDTTRNTLTGSKLAFDENPDQYLKLKNNPALIDSMVPEVIRWQAPIAHMRRTALQDTEIRGKRIKKGDRVVMWYVSGNRDDEAIENPDRFIIDRLRPRTHISFGFGFIAASACDWLSSSFGLSGKKC